tara:strand:- start:386 stop:1195 length:810 start_codon:yes stop_codon:yes gene_type:complete
MFFINYFKEYLKENNNPYNKLSNLILPKKGKFKEKLENHKKENDDKLLNDICENFPSLDKSLLKIKPGTMRYTGHVQYGKKYKIYSMEFLVKNYRIHETVNEIGQILNPSVSDDEIINMWEKCIESDLFPKILEKKNDFVLIEYLDKDFKTLQDLYNEKNIYFVLSIIKKNKDKIYSYYNKIKDQSLCINDFNFKNLVVNEKTKELYMIDMGDIEYTRFFLPEVFILDDINDKLNVFIFKSMCNREENIYREMLSLYYEEEDLNKIYFM